MNFATVQDYQLGKLARKITLANLKRKVRDGEVSPKKLAKRYKMYYPNAELEEKALVWKVDRDVYTLYDQGAKQPRFLLSPAAKALFVPPPGCKVRRYLFEDEIWTPKTTPILTPDALKCIFRHLDGWDLMNCRLVCKKWRQVATNEVALWQLNSCKYLKWNTPLTHFELYVQNMFINAPDAKVIRFFFSQPRFFLYICRLLLGGNKNLRLRKIGNNRLQVGRFTAIRREGLLLCDGTRRVSVQVFLDAHRQKLLREF